MKRVLLLLAVLAALVVTGCDYSRADVQVACEGHEGVHQFAPAARAGRPDIAVCKDGTIVEVGS